VTYHVQQRHKGDCVIAALAMFCKLPYEAIEPVAREHFVDRRRKAGIRDSSVILRKLGYRQENYASDDKPLDGREFRSLWLYEYLISPNILRDYCWGRPAMMSVPSLNEKDGKHMVYYDGHRVWDPQEGRRGKKFYVDYDNKVMPTEAWVWREEV
jgi:hypothetical protein